jgi:hypothetical protein
MAMFLASFIVGIVRCFVELMAVSGRQVQAVDLLQSLDGGRRAARERQLLVEGVEHDPFEKVAERNVKVLSEALQDLQQPALHPHPGLGTLDLYHGNMVPNSGYLEELVSLRAVHVARVLP